MDVAHQTTANLGAAVCLGCAAALILVPSGGARPSLVARAITALAVVVPGAALLFFSLLAYSGGIDGVDTSRSGWVGDPSAWRRPALVVSAGLVVLSVAWAAHRLLNRKRHIWWQAGAAGLGSVCWLLIAYT